MNYASNSILYQNFGKLNYVSDDTDANDFDVLITFFSTSTYNDEETGEWSTGDNKGKWTC